MMGLGKLFQAVVEVQVEMIQMFNSMMVVLLRVKILSLIIKQLTN